MFRNRLTAFWHPVLIALALAAPSLVGAPLGSSFTYQGTLMQQSEPAAGSFDFSFSLFDAAQDGQRFGEPVLVTDLVVADGVFSVELDFGVAPFAGEQLWLEVSVGNPGQLPLTLLTPRQKLSVTPYALHAEFVADESVGVAQIDTTQVQRRITGRCAPGSFMTEVSSQGGVTCAPDTPGSDPVGAAQIDASEIQRRVSGQCPEGTYLRGIDEDGTLRCAQLPVLFSRPLANTTGGLGARLVMRSDGVPLMLSGNSNNTGLLLQVCNDQVCSDGREDVLGTGDIFNASLFVRADDSAIVAFVDTQLFIELCSDSNCTSRIKRNTGLLAVEKPRVVVAPGANPVIAFVQTGPAMGQTSLRAYACDSADCSQGTVHTLDTVSANHPVAFVGGNGLPMIVYYQESAQTLRLYRCLDAACSTGSDRTLASIPGGFTAIDEPLDAAISDAGLAHFYYQGGTVTRARHYRCVDEFCTTGNANEVPLVGSPRPTTFKLVVRDGGVPILSNTRVDFFTPFVEIQQCLNQSCSAAVARRALERTLALGGDLALQQNGRPLIVLLTQSPGGGPESRLVSCGQADCSDLPRAD